MNFSKETYPKTREAPENAIHNDSNYATELAMLAELYVLAQSMWLPNSKRTR